MAAKQLLCGGPGGPAADLPAGPSEVLVIADDSAIPEFVAADLLAQAEHGPDSQVLLVSPSRELIRAVEAAIARALPRLSRSAALQSSLRQSRAILVPDLDAAAEVANAYAPEHLILAVANPRGLLPAIHSAGSVFLGPWTPEALGDYCSGANHVLPTHGYARTASGLSVEDFMRQMTVQEASRAGLAALGPVAERLAALEGLDAHAASVAVRLADAQAAVA
jgi:histidinol dehydrogenase